MPLSARSALHDEAGAIFLGPSDARDRQIERICETVRMAAAAGLRGINYNITLLGNLRTAPRYGRGGAGRLVNRGQGAYKGYPLYADEWPSGIEGLYGGV